MTDVEQRYAQRNVSDAERIRLHDEAVKALRPPVFKAFFIDESGEGFDEAAAEKLIHFEDPEFGLIGYGKPQAILEIVSDNTPGAMNFYAAWLSVETSAEASAYIDVVGATFEVDGPGEDDGIYTVRQIVTNPYYSPTRQ